MPKKKTDKREQEAFNKMGESIRDYLALRGWNLVVISSPKITQELGELKYNYILEVGFTGRNIKCPNY